MREATMKATEVIRIALATKEIVVLGGLEVSDDELAEWRRMRDEPQRIDVRLDPDDEEDAGCILEAEAVEVDFGKQDRLEAKLRQSLRDRELRRLRKIQRVLWSDDGPTSVTLAITPSQLVLPDDGDEADEEPAAVAADGDDGSQPQE